MESVSFISQILFFIIKRPNQIRPQNSSHHIIVRNQHLIATQTPILLDLIIITVSSIGSSLPPLFPFLIPLLFPLTSPIFCSPFFSNCIPYTTSLSHNSIHGQSLPITYTLLLKILV